MRHLDVYCDTAGCPVAGRTARVWLQLVALNVVAVPRLVCTRCGCDVARRVPEGEQMAKITAHGGPTDARSNPPVPTVVDPPTPDVPAEQAPAAPEETEPAAEAPAEASAPKRRGRPRKAVTT